MQYPVLQRKWLTLGVAIVGFVVALLAASMMSVDTAHRMLVEGGPVEVATAIVQFVVAGAAAILWYRHGGLFGLLAVAAFLMGAREIDLHTAFTTHGIFSTKEYFRADTPVIEKLLAGAALLAIIALLIGSLLSCRREIARLYRERAPALYGIATIVLILPMLKTFDALPRVAREMGMPIGDIGLKYLLALEEIGEMVLPALVAVVLLQLLGQATVRAGSPSVDEALAARNAMRG